MPVKISDLLPKKVKIATGGGDFEVGPLSMEGIVSLIENHREMVLHLIASLQGTPNFMALIQKSPELCASVIAYAADAVGQEADIRQLPFTVQAEALTEVWSLSVPNPKKAKELLSVVMGQLRRLSQEAAAKASTLTTSSETSQADSAPSFLPATA